MPLPPPRRADNRRVYRSPERIENGRTGRTPALRALRPFSPMRTNVSPFSVLVSKTFCFPIGPYCAASLKSIDWIRTSSLVTDRYSHTLNPILPIVASGTDRKSLFFPDEERSRPATDGISTARITRSVFFSTMRTPGGNVGPTISGRTAKRNAPVTPERGFSSSCASFPFLTAVFTVTPCNDGRTNA